MGEVVKQAFGQHRKKWEVSVDYMNARRKWVPYPSPNPRAESSEGGFKRGVIETQLSDGSKLCSEFNKGHCKYGADCRNGKHVCGMLIGKGKVCGKSHSASKHDWSFKPQNSKNWRR